MRQNLLPMGMPRCVSGKPVGRSRKDDAFYQGAAVVAATCRGATCRGGGRVVAADVRGGGRVVRRTLARDRHSGYGDTATQRGSGGDRAQRTAGPDAGGSTKCCRVWVREPILRRPRDVRYLAVSENLPPWLRRTPTVVCERRHCVSALHRRRDRARESHSFFLHRNLAVAALAFFSGSLIHAQHDRQISLRNGRLEGDGRICGPSLFMPLVPPLRSAGPPGVDKPEARGVPRRRWEALVPEQGSNLTPLRAAILSPLRMPIATPARPKG